METPPPLPTQRFPTWKQVLVMVLGGIALAATACVGFLVSLNGNFERGGDAVWTPLAAILFCAGVLGFLIGLVLLLIRVGRSLGSQPQSPASGDPPKGPGL